MRGSGSCVGVLNHAGHIVPHSKPRKYSGKSGLRNFVTAGEWSNGEMEFWSDANGEADERRGAEAAEKRKGGITRICCRERAQRTQGKGPRRGNGAVPSAWRATRRAK